MIKGVRQAIGVVFELLRKETAQSFRKAVT
jgi:hypothetical protein